MASDLRGRILALGRAHDFVRPHSEASRPEKRPDSLAGMLSSLLEAYVERVDIAGEEIVIDDRSATPLALVFHELATNAAKYGALAVPEGSVSITSWLDRESAHIEWVERGGPAIQEPANYGFGSQLIDLSVVRQMGGQMERKWSPEGLEVRLKFPISAMLRPASL